jgi:hypothetical protein
MVVSDTDDVLHDYADALDRARTLPDLRQATMQYREVASDAFDVTASMSEDELCSWRAALKKERQGRFMGKRAAKRFGPVLMPSLMVKVMLVAEQYGLPWGSAYNQLKQARLITLDNGVAKVEF